MEWIGTNALQALKKYRWAALVVLLGVFLMCLPTGVREESAQPEPQENQERDLEQDLAALLQSLEGAGQVRLLLTREVGERTVYQTDEDRSGQGENADLRRETVLITAADRSQTGLVRQVLAPTYRGAVVLCQGADSAAVRLAVVEAVASATGLTTDKITVLKMK